VFSSGVEAQCLVTQAASRFFYHIDIHGRAGRVSLRGSDFTDFEVEAESQTVPAYAHPAVVRPRWYLTAVALIVPLDNTAKGMRAAADPAANKVPCFLTSVVFIFGSFVQAGDFAGAGKNYRSTVPQLFPALVREPSALATG
jgi:hypothetical protein